MARRREFLSRLDGQRTFGWVIASGAALRLIQYADRRSLWEDEARVALNVASRSWAGLLEPLDYAQAAPVPWLWAQRLLVIVGGVNEYTLRFQSLVAGILLLALVWKLTRRVLPEWQALLATALIAYSPLLIRYSSEAKPYEIDALVAVGLAILALDVACDPANWRSWRWLLLGGLVAVTVSFPAIFVLAGVGMALILPVRAVRFGVTRLLLVGTAWVTAFGGLYLAFYRPLYQGHFLREFWEFAFLRLGAPDLALRAWSAVYDVMSGALVGSLDPGRWGRSIVLGTQIHASLAAALCVVGGLVFVRRREFPVATLLAGPLLLAAGASTLGLYPITARLIVFAVPGLFLLLGRGIVQLGEWLPQKLRALGVVLLAATFIGPEIGRGVLTSISPIRRQDTRPVIAEFVRRHQGTDPVYIYAAATPAWAFYTTNWAKPDMERLRWIARRSDADGGPAFPYRLSRGRSVVGEGEDLNYTYQGHVELIGVPTGRTLRWGLPVSDAPDPGWADNEAERIRRAGTQAWVFFMPIYPGDREPNLGELLLALERQGGTVDFEFHRREADLYRYRFTSKENASR